MKGKFFVLVTTLVISSLPLIAYADISVINNTAKDGTAYIGTKGCTSKAGEMGILKHNSTTVIPQFIINQYCGDSCEVKAYITRDCSGEKIATATVDRKLGVTKIENHNVDGYVVTGGGKSITVNRNKKWYDFIFQF